MIEGPLSRIEIKILAIIAAVVIVTGIAYYSYVNNTKEHEEAIAAPKTVALAEPVLTPGWHLIKMQHGKNVTLNIVTCEAQDKCTTTGYQYNPDDKDDVARAEETYNDLAHPPVNKVLEVIH